jgi:hypothetical protein
MNFNFQKPFFIAILFNLFTLALYYLGPWSFQGQSYFPAIWIGAYLFFLILGYFLGKTIYITKISLIDGYRTRSAHRIDSLARWSAIITIILFFPTFFSRINLAALFSDPLAVGKLYQESLQQRAESTSVIEYVRMFFGPFLFCLMPLTFFYWKKLRFNTRSLVLLGIALNFLLYFFSGTNKIFFEALLFFGISVILNDQGEKIRKRKRIFTVISLITFSLFVFYFFVQTQISRTTSGVTASVIYFEPANGISKLSDSVPLEVRVFLNSFSIYLIQGYAAFDKSRTVDFTSTFPVGNSTFFSRQYDRIFNVQLSDQTYPAKLEDLGWDRYVFWSSFYLWFASDYSYFGVVVILFFIGALFGFLTRHLFFTENMVSFILICYLFVMLIYLPMNNQIFQSGETAVGFLITLTTFFWQSLKLAGKTS